MEKWKHNKNFRINKRKEKGRLKERKEKKMDKVGKAGKNEVKKRNE